MDSPPAQTVAALQGVGHAFVDAGRERWVLRGVDLDLAPGEVLVVLGRSGSGKTTLLNVLATLEAPREGAVWHRQAGVAVNLAQASEAERTRFRRRHVGFVFQHLNLIPTLTVLENAALCAHLNRDAAAVARAAALLDQVGLGGREQDFPDTLSGGEQQRVAVVRALAHRPPLVIADEPTGSLDVETAGAVMQLLVDQARRHGAALVVATHHRDFAALGDRSLDLGAGVPGRAGGVGP